MLQVTKRKSAVITDAVRSGDALVLRSERGTLRLAPQTESIVRVSFSEGASCSEKTGVGIRFGGSFSGWSWKETADAVTLCLPALTLDISKAAGSITYRNADGSLLLAEAAEESRALEPFDSYRTVVDENTKVEETVTPDGVKRVIKEASSVFDRKLCRTRLSLTFQPDERLYGLGQAEEGLLNLRGSTQYLHQANLKIAIPFLLSSKGYGLLFATGSPAVFSDTQYGSYFYTEADEQMDFYFIRGSSLDGVVGGYRTLTGKAAMLPRWAFGFLQSQERYETQEEILEIAGEYRRRGIGLDCVVLDWCSWTGDQWGQKSFDPVRFPDPAGMTGKLHEQNVRFMLSIWPNMQEDTADYREFSEKGLLLPASEIYDALNPDARALYWKQTREKLFRSGVDAWWCDSSEPFTPEWSRGMKPEPSDMYREFLETASKYLPREAANAYGLFHAQTMYEGQRETGSSKRVVNLTRSTYTGGQRYGVILWSGDTAASWETLRRQIPAGLNFCASGFPYWTVDIGAFFVKKGVQWFWDGDYEDGLSDLGYRELFVRWFQYGAFLPVFRSHGTDVRREMWAFGEDGDPFYEALKSANRLRYRLIPYLYSWAWKVWKEDSTMMRMLAFDFPNDEKALDIGDEYMLGGSILVCPVTEPMYYGPHSQKLNVSRKGRMVYLPAGCDWYDFHTGEKYAGGRSVFAEAGIDRIPLFVRAGSILPMTRPLQHTGEQAEIEFYVYPGADAEFTLYEDSGDGYGYESGDCTVRRLVWKDAEQKLLEGGRTLHAVIAAR